MKIAYKNSEFKSFAWKLVLFQIIFSLFMYSYMSIIFDNFNIRIINQNSALTGKILINHPELIDELPKLITNTATIGEIEFGKKILSEYGYNEQMEILTQPILGRFYTGIKIKTLLIVLFMLIPLLCLTSYEYKKIYKKARSLSVAAEKVIDGDFSCILPVEVEGDFGVLYNNFNQMANRLKLSLDRLKQDKLFLKNIISDISHQLKTPLSSLIMFNDILMSNENMDKSNQQAFLNKSSSQLARMEWLIISLLKMTRLEAGVINFKNKNTPLLIPIKHAIDSLSIMANEKHQTINVIGNANKVYFNGDSEWLSEALINIIKNCIEHTDKYGEIEIKTSETPLFSRIVIKDNGEGISQKDLPHVFERFYTANSCVKTNSIGIGLALSKLIIEGQNGSITVSSIKGIGTKFTITFLKTII
ncbi:sensor histidine kinase [Abyssisolibacter fermentans]|uniref:sensor histidine kinase n=1 Tax=Abyssisolibacter fermentans TaxID=1766203 RepID=UPI00083032B1|nr:HAMP domain-containing sensor histidine kinase [Abyssisolibacter fermentans]